MAQSTLSPDVSLGLSTRLAWLGVLAVCAVWMYHAVPWLGTVYEDENWRFAVERADRAEWGVRSRPVMLAIWRYVGGVHALSLALHLVNAALVGWLARRLGLSESGAWIAGAMFLLLPLQSEAVAYLSAQAEVIAACAVLSACVLATSRTAWIAWLALPVIAIGCLAKESAIVGVALLPLVRRWWGGWAITLAGCLGAAVWLSAMTWHLSLTPVWVFWQTAAAGRLLTQVWPSALTVDYDYAALTWTQGLGFAGLVTLAAGAAIWHRSIGGALAISVIALRLVTVTPLSLLNEHQVYLAVAGLALCAGTLTDRMAACRR